MHVQRLLAILFIISLTCPIAFAQHTPDSSSMLRQLLEKHRYPVELNEEELSGEGGTWLKMQARDATIVTLGETHASQEIPILIEALIKDLQRSDEFDYLAIEASPWTTELINQKLKEGKSAYNKFIHTYPWAIPFYNFRSERDLLYKAVRGSDRVKPLWGMDQIFAFSTSLALDRLAEMAPSDSIRTAIQEIRTVGQTKSADDPRLQNLPEDIPPSISVFDPATFDTLHTHFKGIEEAQNILDEMVKSIRIYRLNDDNNYASNQVRARYLRSNLRKRVQQARSSSNETPQIVIKTGARHAYRGITPNNALDVGNLAVSLARSMGGEAFNVAVLCGPGSQSLSFPARTTGCWPEYLGDDFKSLAGEKPVLFDLTAVQPKLHESGLEITPELKDFLWGFDAVVIIPNTKPAEPIISNG